MSEMVERVARAICRVAGFDPDAETPGECNGWEWFGDHARAAIEAMREPTEGMIQTACDKHTPGVEMRSGGECPKLKNAAHRWRAMIDAALKVDQ